MKRLLEPLVFLGLATAVHAGVWIGFGGGGGAPAGGGAGSGAALVLEAASAETVAMVRRWQAPPEIAAGLVMPAAPALAEAPALLVPPAPEAPVPAPAVPRLEAPGARVLADVPPSADAFASAPPVAEASPPTPSPPDPGAPVPPALAEEPPDAEAVASAPPPDAVRPRPRPEPQALRPPEAAAPPAPAQPPRSSAATPGPGGGGQAGQTAPGRLRAAEAEWGATILARIARQQRYPAGEHGSGTARVALTVGRDGRLRDVRLAASSGSPALDRAALEAVRRAGRFPAAPAELDKGSYVFAVPMTFRRN
jgi:protein TonB